MGVLIGWSHSPLLIGLAAFLYFVFISISGALNMLVLLLGYAHPRVRRLEQELPDAITKQLGD